MFLHLFSVALLSAVASLVEASAPSVQVVDALIARDVLARQPVEPGDTFSSDVGTLVCWSKVISKQVPSKLVYVWYYQDKEVSRSVLDIKSPKWRAWSRKTIQPGQEGSWKVELRDAGGTLLESVVFNVVASLPIQDQAGP